VFDPTGTDDASCGATLAYLLQQLTTSIDKTGFQVHTILIVGPAPQPDRPKPRQILQPKFDISQPSECAVLNDELGGYLGANGEPLPPGGWGYVR
jgi:hypothetical protein